jgi:hypothetical protein
MAAYDDATPQARAAYDAAEAHNEAAWNTYDTAARDPDVDDLPAWGTYRATLGPLHKARAALFTPELDEETGQMTLFDVKPGAAHAA